MFTAWSLINSAVSSCPRKRNYGITTTGDVDYIKFSLKTDNRDFSEKKRQITTGINDFEQFAGNNETTPYKYSPCTVYTLYKSI